MAIDLGIGVQTRLFAALGVLCVALGIVGVFLPGLPTTEFILAASYLFARSSPALEGMARATIAGWGRRCGGSGRRGGMPLESQSARTGLDVDGPRDQPSRAGHTRLGVQMAMVAMGVVGTVTILFFVRTTAATTAAHPVVAGGRGGAENPAPVLHSDLRDKTLSQPKVRVLFERFSQPIVTKPFANTLHQSERALEGVARLIGTPGVLEKVPKGELGFPALNRVSQVRSRARAMSGSGLQRHPNCVPPARFLRRAAMPLPGSCANRRGWPDRGTRRRALVRSRRSPRTSASSPMPANIRIEYRNRIHWLACGFAQ